MGLLRSLSASAGLGGGAGRAWDSAIKLNPKPDWEGCAESLTLLLAPILILVLLPLPQTTLPLFQSPTIPSHPVLACLSQYKLLCATPADSPWLFMACLRHLEANAGASTGFTMGWNCSAPFHLLPSQLPPSHICVSDLLYLQAEVYICLHWMSSTFKVYFLTQRSGLFLYQGTLALVLF